MSDSFSVKSNYHNGCNNTHANMLSLSLSPFSHTHTHAHLQHQVEEIYKLQSGIDQLKREAARQEEEKVAVQSRLEEVRAEQATKREGWRRLEEQWAAEKKKLMSEVEHLKEESGALQERYGSQVRVCILVVGSAQSEGK